MNPEISASETTPKQVVAFLVQPHSRHKNLVLVVFTGKHLGLPRVENANLDDREKLAKQLFDLAKPHGHFMRPVEPHLRQLGDEEEGPWGPEQKPARLIFFALDHVSFDVPIPHYPAEMIDLNALDVRRRFEQEHPMTAPLDVTLSLARDRMSVCDELTACVA